LCVAREHFKGPEYIQGDLERKPWYGTFDTIISFETLEHLANPQVVVGRFKESLNPGGVFICSVPNEEWYPFNPETFKDDVYPHQRHYTPDEFRALLPFDVEFFCQKSKQAPEVVPGTEGKFLIAVCR
jgi:SAM-dependent methyltransferase